MELENPSNGEPEDAVGGGGDEVLLARSSPPRRSPACYADDFDSACSTPFVSAPSSPGRGGGGLVAVSGGYFFSAPSSPMHYILSSSAFSHSSPSDPSSSAFEFEFSARFPASAAAAADGSMSSADELFLNGQIRPMKLSSHLQRPQNLAPLMDLNGEADDDDDGDKFEAGKDGREPSEENSGGRGRDLKLRSRSIHRRARSLSPLRNAPFLWRLNGGERAARNRDGDVDPGHLQKIEAEIEVETETPPVSASSSRSSSTSSSSSSSSTSSTKKRWISFKDLLHRSKSEGSGKNKEKFWHAIPFSALKDRPKPPPAASATNAPLVPPPPSSDPEKKPAATSASSKRTGTSDSARRRGRRGAAAPSPHERLYTANRAQAEEMRRRTFLPYRQGLLGCLGFSSRGYFAINGLARSLHTVSSR